MSSIPRLQPRTRCVCCDGSGEVTSASGELRPCSRCRFADFREEARSPEGDARDRAGRGGEGRGGAPHEDPYAGRRAANA